ncbi:hypothetical protein BH09PSE5_BH09PSE5_48420 [soil metagenome]
MKQLLIFGANAHAERVLQLARQSVEFESVELVDNDRSYSQPGFAGVPIRSREEALGIGDKRQFAAFVAMGEKHLNQDRLAAYMTIRQAGFTVAALRGPSSEIADGIRLRDNVFVDARVRVLARANIGANTWIHSGTEIGVGAKLGSSCWISAGCVIGDGATLGKNCTLGPNVRIGAGVAIPAWSTINESIEIKQSLARATFIDAMFRAPVTLHEK